MASRLFPLQFDEGDVQQLCGAAAFTRADNWQRVGHVAKPVAGVGTLTGEVRGTWQRVDTPTISAPGEKVQCACSCRQPTLCVHGATVLLHWLRQPAAFTKESPATQSTFGERQSEPAFDLDDFADGDADDNGVGVPDEPTAAADLAKLLDLFSMQDLRDVARRRGVRPTGRTKSDLSRQLAEALSRPESIDAALARLSSDELLTLLCIDVLGPDLATTEALTTAVQVIGRAAATTSVDALLAQALVGIVQFYGSTAATFAVPVAVTGRLGRLPALGRPLDTDPAPSAGGLDLLQGLLVLVHEAQARPVPTRPDPLAPNADRSAVPAFWSVVVPQQAGAATAAYATPYRKVRLAPIPPMLGQEERQRQAQRMGRSPDFVTLALHVALTLEIIDVHDNLTAESEREFNLCTLSPVVRRQVYVAALAAPHYLGELRRLVGEGGPLELHCHLGYFGQTTPLLNQAAQLRLLLLRAVDRLPRDVWYDYRTFRESLRQWAPFHVQALSFAQVGGGQRPTWWISDHQQPDQPLDLTTPAGWQQLYGCFVDDVFAGVLSWIGMIDLASSADGPQAFRVRSLDTVAGVGGERLQLEDDLTIQVPAGLSDGGAYILLERGAELMHVSPMGLRYRLRPERVRDLFEQGVDGPLLTRLLEGHAGQPMPAVMRATIDRWWAGYGQVRLYDDLTLIELADDYLLPELLRTTSLASSIIYTFSPRLIAIEPEAVERLSAEMTRAGHPPSIAEGP